ncbi:MAG: FHA domain-containing protein [Micrococcales bacterium]|nr:FHA domain-containing protein [Micrococcales bacterium]
MEQQAVEAAWPSTGPVPPPPGATVGLRVICAPAVAVGLPTADPGTGADLDAVEPTVVVDRSALGQWSLVLDDGQTFDLWSTSVVVGRRPRLPSLGVQTLTILDKALSKTHARLDLVDGTWQVTDLGSTNGVVVAGADGQDTEVARGGAAPVYGYLEMGAVGARIVPTAQVDGTVPPARQSGSTVPLAQSGTASSVVASDQVEPEVVPEPAAVAASLVVPAERAPQPPDAAVDRPLDEGDVGPSTDGGTMTSKRETAAVRQFVGGTMSLGVFVQLLHRDLPLREYLAGGAGLAAYAQADLLGQLLRTDWQDMVGVRQAQQLLEQFLRDQGVDVDPTDLYQERVDFHQKFQSLLTQLQPPWLKIPVPYVARLLKECAEQTDDGDCEDLLRRRVESRFRFLTHPPQWLHEEYWPVGRHGPLVFVEQVDLVPDRPGTAVNYVFVDPRNGAFLVLPQTRPEPVAEDAAAPTPAEIRLPRGVVPVFARPGAFWLAQPDARRGAAPGQSGGQARDDGPTVASAAGDAQPSAAGDASAPAQPSAPQTELLPGAVPEPESPAADVDQAPTADQPAGAGIAVPPTVPMDPPAPAGPATPGPTEDDLEVTVVGDLPTFRPWTLVLSDGRTFSVESRSVVVGRRPQTGEPGVQVLALDDSTRSLSKTHARLEMMGGAWHVTDLGSTNGVVVTAADGQETKAEPGQPVPVYGYVAFGSVEARLQPDPVG